MKSRTFQCFVIALLFAHLLCLPASAQFAISPNEIRLGTGGVVITNDGDGALTITGAGNGSDEALTVNLDDTPDTAVWSSSTGINIWSMSGISISAAGISVDTEAYDATGWNGDMTVPTKDAVRDKIETLSAGSTDWNGIGDATADGTTALAAYETLWTSSLDTSGKTIWTITNTDADAANDTSFFDLRHNDVNDADIYYMRFFGDDDGNQGGTTADYSFSQTAFGVGSNVTSTFSGPAVFSLPIITPTTEALSATTALVANKFYSGAIDTRTVTISAASSFSGSHIRYTGTAAAPTVITWPASTVRQTGGSGYASSTTFAAGNVEFDLWSNGTDWFLADSSGTTTTAAPTDATYITQTANSTLTNEQALASLATGIVKNTTTTGVLSIAAAGTDYLAPNGSAAALTGAVVAGGGTGVASLTAYAPIFGGTTSTGAVQSGTVGTAGHVLTSNGAGALPTFQAAAGGSGPTINGYRQNIFLWDECLGTIPSSGPIGPFEFNRTVANSALTGTGLPSTSEATAPGVYQLETGTNPAGAVALTATTSGVLLGAGTYTFETRLQVSDLADGTNSYTVRFGFLDSASGEPTDGCYFRYSEADASWFAVCRSNGTETASATDTAVDLVADTWVVLRVEVNAAATSVVFKINGTTVRTETANIPTGAGRATGMGVSFIKTLGSATRILYHDLFGAEIGLTSSR